MLALNISWRLQICRSLFQVKSLVPFTLFSVEFLVLIRGSSLEGAVGMPWFS
jgi:hypothetical protein